MNNSFGTIALLACFSVVEPSSAADRVRFPEGNLSWTVQIRYLDGFEAELTTQPAQGDASVPKSVPAPKAVGVACVSHSGVERYRITWSDRKTTEAWRQQGILLAKDPVTDRIGYFSGPLLPGLIGSLDASLFSWISDAPGTEVVYEQRKSFHYRKPASSGTPGASLSGEEWRNRQAWIDRETLLPLAYENGVASFRFTFQAAPAALLQMPQDFAKLHARILATTSRHPSWRKTP